MPPKLNENFKSTYHLDTNINSNFQHISIKITLFTNNKKSLPKIIKIEPLDTHELKKFSSDVKSSKNKMEISKVLSSKNVEDRITFSELIQMGYPFKFKIRSDFFPVFQLQRK